MTTGTERGAEDNPGLPERLAKIAGRINWPDNRGSIPGWAEPAGDAT